MQRTDADEIRQAAGEPLAGAALLPFRQRRKDGTDAVVDHIDLLRRDAVGLHDVLLGEFRNGDDAGGFLREARKAVAVVAAVCGREVLGEMLEVEVVDHGELGNVRAEAEVSVRREKGIGAVFAQGAWQYAVEPDAVEDGMARGRRDHHGRHVRAMDELPGIGSIKEVDELVLRMRGGDALKRFMREPTDAFELARKEEAGVYGDAHGGKDGERFEF